MFKTGFQIINIDISEIVIKQMAQTYKDCVWRTMDATAMDFKDEEFSVILDKGTLDAMMSEETETSDTVLKYFAEVKRVLKNGGRFVCISLLQEHIIKHLLEFFPSNNFLFRVVRCLDAELQTSQTNEDGSSMPVFAVIATKFMKLPSKILEISQDGEAIERVNGEDALKNSILSIQRASMIRNGLIRKSSYEDEINFDLFRPNEKTPRFSLYILDQKTTRNLKEYAAFICPQGRETEWLFSTKQGRKKLLESAQHARLAIVVMHRNQSYTSIDEIKVELNETIKSFAPKELRDMSKIPFLSLGSDVGSRQEVYKGTSNISGDFVVEDVTIEDDQVFRRLIFMSNQNVIQSEARLKRLKKKVVADHNHLSCQHHIYLILGVLMMENPSNLQNLVIGLGGGGLLTFIYHNLKELKMTVVEIDPEIVKVAKEYFGLVEEKNRMDVIVDDGLLFLKNKSQKYHSIIFDVDSKDQSLGISCPPKEFLEKDILTAVEQSLAPNGIFIINFVCRDESTRNDILKSLKNIFPSVYSYNLDEDVNEIFYCFKTELKNYREKFTNAGKKLKSLKRDLIDVTELFEKLLIN
jgi:spermidine synthase